MRSWVSVKGPSITVFWSAENRTRFPLELGCSPSPASITPALASSSLYLPMSARICSLGIAPASLSSLAFTSTITRIVISPLGCIFGAGPPGGSDPVETSLCRYVEQGYSKSTRMPRSPQPRRPLGECVGQRHSTASPCYRRQESLGMAVAVRSLPPREQREPIPCVAPQILRALEADRGQEQQRQDQL